MCRAVRAARAARAPLELSLSATMSCWCPFRAALARLLSRFCQPSLDCPARFATSQSIRSSDWRRTRAEVHCGRCPLSERLAVRLLGYVRALTFSRGEGVRGAGGQRLDDERAECRLAVLDLRRVESSVVVLAATQVRHMLAQPGACQGAAAYIHLAGLRAGYDVHSADLRERGAHPPNARLRASLREV